MLTQQANRQDNSEDFDLFRELREEAMAVLLSRFVVYYFLFRPLFFLLTPLTFQQ